MAANSASSLAEEMSRFEEEISGAGPGAAPKTMGAPTQAMHTGPPPGFAPMMSMMRPPGMPGPGPIGPPGMPGPGPIGPPGVGPMPPGPGMMPPSMPSMPMPGMPPHMMPPPMGQMPPAMGQMPPAMGQMPFMMAMPMPVPISGTASSAAASGGVTMTNEQKKEWESQFSTGGSAAAAATGGDSKKKKKKNLRVAAGVTWVDQTLDEWDENDFRIFVGDLGHECTDEVLFRAFSKYPSLKKCKIVRDNRTNKSRGFGFVSFKDPKDYLAAMRDMQGKYVAGRPIKLRKSTWKDRQLTVARKKQKEKARLGLK